MKVCSLVKFDHTGSKVLLWKFDLSLKCFMKWYIFQNANNFKLVCASNNKIFANYFCLYHNVLHQLTQHPGKLLFYPLLWVYLPTKTATNCLRSLIQIVSRWRLHVPTNKSFILCQKKFFCSNSHRFMYAMNMFFGKKRVL